VLASLATDAPAPDPARSPRAGAAAVRAGARRRVSAEVVDVATGEVLLDDGADGPSRRRPRPSCSPPSRR
jgi:D-alanyl-D-alanine carboxypeptidase/D-alanyl-D-alanine-endopeptidase (penicillin-binding protein 4)